MSILRIREPASGNTYPIVTTLGIIELYLLRGVFYDNKGRDMSARVVYDWYTSYGRPRGTW